MSTAPRGWGGSPISEQTTPYFLTFLETGAMNIPRPLVNKH